MKYKAGEQANLEGTILLILTNTVYIFPLTTPWKIITPAHGKKNGIKCSLYDKAVKILLKLSIIMT